MAFVLPLILAAAAPQAPPSEGLGENPPEVHEPGEWTIEWSFASLPLPAQIAAPEGRAVWNDIADAFRADPARQVRIEQRMIIRITPFAATREMLAALPQAPLATRFREKKVGKCVSVAGIAGVQIGGDDRLMLFMRDQRMIGASLEKACRARDFYSGFYLERNGDGQLCVDRDLIHSRSGASCSLSRLRRLVAIDE
ncbi:hypothetical protein [Novosphingobium sp. Gsoil 351]|uniref:hypothetical protein n=1 Tax=Novosphingobium sp. Gsoil 351 TaxID=2675225 RepID=UPI0012B467C1|nr:hypothetical protein [Novosphingobium sp. Gsoil 351]QGN53622.1 hypothetical protein GKE62_02750 [Novosphingobium sp. Gsoil 351]